MSNIKTPTIGLNWSEKDFGKLGTIKYPTGFKVGWHAKGAIFTQPTIIGQHGFGEAGPEAALPLNPFWKRLDAIGSEITGTVAAKMDDAGRGGGTVTLVVTLDGTTIAQRTVRYINDQTIMLGTSPLNV